MKNNMRLLSRALSVGLSLALCAGMVAPAFAASFSDLQNAIDGNGKGTAFETEDGDTRYGYGEKNDETGKYGVEAWDTEGGRNVQLNEEVKREDGETGVVIKGGKDVTLDLNGNDIDAKTEEGKTLDGSVITVGQWGEKNNSLTLNDSAATGTEENGDYESGEITGGLTAIDMQTGNKFTMNEGTLANNDGDGLGGGVVDRGEFTMNGGVISNNDVTGKGGGVFVNATGNFTMNGGAITGNTSGDMGGGVFVSNGGQFTMNGGTISNNTATNNGGGVYSDNTTVNVNGGTIGSNTASNGGGVYTNKGTLTMNGGTIGNNTATAGNGGGVYVDNGTFTMEGGTIDGNKTSLEKGTYVEDGHPDGQGGGVYAIGKDAKFNLSGGTISNNEAGEGGGVFIGNTDKNNAAATFEMTGGTVTGNTAHWGEGGGIYVYGKGTIKAGQITNNTTLTQHDLGGGGIYVEDLGTLQMYNVIITENTANGLGGGLSACVHGKTIVHVKDGAIIFGNKADGTSVTQGHTKYDPNGNGWFIDGHKIWENDEAFKAGAQDVFTASDSTQVSTVTGIPGVIISGNTLFGDANWEGTAFLFLYNEDGSLKCDEETGEPLYAPVEIDHDGVVYANRLLGMTAKPDADTIAAAKAAAKEAVKDHVIISGNHSNTHGGGIGNNGVLTIGTKGPFEDDETPDDVTGNKYLEKVEGAPADSEDRELENEEFTFVLTDTTDEDNKKEFTGTNDKDGNVVIDLPEDYLAKEGTYTFTMAEKNTGKDGITYDKTVYQVTITVKKVIEKHTIGSEEVTIERLVPETKIVMVTDKNGNAVNQEVNGVSFTNVYTPTVTYPQNPTTPPTTPPPSDPPEEPELEEPEIPLDEEPELEEPEIPLDELPEEEELDEPDIPLSDVPQTGDISLAWYAALIMSVCGLAVLAVSKKREGTEG